MPDIASTTGPDAKACKASPTSATAPVWNMRGVHAKTLNAIATAVPLLVWLLATLLAIGDVWSSWPPVMKASATRKQAEAQLSRRALLSIFCATASDLSLMADKLPMRLNAQDAEVAKPMEEMKLRTCWNPSYLASAFTPKQVTSSTDCVAAMKN